MMLVEGLMIQNNLQLIHQQRKKIPGQGLHWVGSFRFRKATPQEEQEYYSNMKGEIQDQISSLVLKEEYEEAAKLQKQLI